MKVLGEDIRDQLASVNPEALCFDGFDEAIIGISERCGQPPLAVYSRSGILEILMRDGCTPEEAVEFYEYNMVGAWVGEHTPIVVDLECS